MSQLPPGHFTDFTQDAPQKQRISILAISSLVLSFICCIPGVSALGAGLGIAAVIVIGRASGRLTGNALAVVGVVLGLLITAGWAAVGLGTSSAIRQFKSYETVLVGAQTSDMSTARKMLSVEADQAITDERIVQFGQEFNAEWGSFVDVPAGVGPYISGLLDAGPQWQVMQLAQNEYPGKQLIPLPAEFDNGSTLVFVVIDKSQIRANTPSIKNMGIVTHKDKVIWLIDPNAP